MKSIPLIPVIDVKKYGGKQVALVDGKVIATGMSLRAVVSRAKKAAPKRALHEIKIFSVPHTLAVVYYVAS